MPDSDKSPEQTTSLFGKNDIVHDIETVQAKWAREQVRRRAQMMKVFIIGGICLLAILGSTLYKIHKNRAYRRAMEEQEAKKYNPIGYRDAKIHILFFFSDSSEGTEDILREAVDNKPSEFYLEFKPLEGVDGDEVMAALGAFTPGVSINGQHVFKIKEENGEEKTIKLLGDDGQNYRLKELGTILNQIHRQTYGESYLRPINSQFDQRVQNIEIEGIDDDSSQSETVKKSHEHDKEDEAAHEAEGIRERQSFSPDELIVPKLDVKEPK